MTRIDLFLAILAVLVVAMLSGWALHLLWARLTHRGAADAERLHEMAERLHEVELERDAAERRLQEAEETLRAALAEREAELGAAMESVGDLRRQLSEWQSAYEALQAARNGE